MSTPQERLIGGYYNSGAFSGANPGGLANGGHVQNFPAALQDIGAVAQDVGVKAGQVQANTQTVTSAAASASQDRHLAQQAAAAAAGSAGSVTGKADLTGATFTGNVGIARSGINAVFSVSGDAGRVRQVIWQTGGVARWILQADETPEAGGNAGSDLVLMNRNDAGAPLSQAFRVKRETGEFQFARRATFGGVYAWDAGNDGSGSGLDADMLRGLLPAVGGSANTVVVRDANGQSGFSTVGIASNGAISFNSGPSVTRRSATEMTVSGGLYLDGNLSASVVTERSDRSLKRDIVALSVPAGRLRPVAFRMRETDELRVGFIAQEVAQVQPLAVAYPEEGAMEVRLMGVIAHLAAQLNDALDRLEQLEKR